ncbi:branched-chain amino acid ABC transporter permease [Roseomonas sp. GC11]|uniref:branched-chain amino acid ABC transporter permease n=1 Tax=Roseomonas sp. GC11 TaxID=2950546 RepID=UPI00210D29B8|nr:branched-chain amino acid ABC transporter permease [Roseomonas sp. GC11]MCQ4159110.1 branched-chain amino acid ABC transporter permease [Roseomonas sp. GC11]
MTALLRRQALPLALLLALALVPVLGVQDGFSLGLLARAMILGIAATSLSLLVGGAGLASLGHAAALGIGAYAVATLDLLGITEGAVVFPAAILAAALYALLTGLVSLRTGGVHFIMITLAFGQMVYFATSSLSALGGDDGYTLYGRTEFLGARLLEGRLPFHYLCLGLAAATWLFCSMLLESRFGRVLRAAKEEPMRVRALGLSPYPYRLVAMTIAGALAGLAGALMANAMEFVSPAILSWPRSADLLFMVILGGVGHLHGALLGALALVLAEEVLSHLWDHWRLLFGPLLILAVIFLRGGLAGLPALLAQKLVQTLDRRAR